MNGKPDADSVIADYFPRIAGYVANHYRWIENRGHCMFTVDDIIQIACILAIQIARQWEEEGHPVGLDDKSRARFFGYLKAAIKNKIAVDMRDSHASNDLISDSFDEDPGDNATENRAAIGAARGGGKSTAPHLLHGIVAEYFQTIPRRDKAVIALRYFDELTLTEIGSLMGMTADSTASLIGRIVERWRRFALNHVVTDVEPMPPLRPRPWEPTEELDSYIQSRYQCDISSYLGFFTIALRVDAEYMVSILRPERTYVPSSRADRRGLDDLQAQQADAMLAAGMSKAAVARALGVGANTIQRHATRTVNV